MRPVTRNTLLGIIAVVVLLLALGALPGFLKSGDPYYAVATPTDGEYSVENGTAVNWSTQSDRRFPYTSGALADASPSAAGQSDPYWRGPFGFKGAFTHSPFDERDALRQQYGGAVTDDGVVVRYNGTFYHVAVRQDV
ncbi:hypothetical protein NDI54_00265 [Haloarcula sp. S1AR25-5A]|uniref:Uncharacterized protein n=1 Tax=Haloarcula terrestris TaxID=2950533 RepID=A0AAE4JFP9_9EURY|nr:hypothetical protein [Haloarcula terrestris]MDS0219785.1 hypothetical protein [Haloarcula terrestris]